MKRAFPNHHLESVSSLHTAFALAVFLGGCGASPSPSVATDTQADTATPPLDPMVHQCNVTGLKFLGSSHRLATFQGSPSTCVENLSQFNHQPNTAQGVLTVWDASVPACPPAQSGTWCQNPMEGALGWLMDITGFDASRDGSVFSVLSETAPPVTTVYEGLDGTSGASMSLRAIPETGWLSPPPPSASYGAGDPSNYFALQAAVVSPDGNTFALVGPRRIVLTTPSGSILGELAMQWENGLPVPESDAGVDEVQSAAFSADGQSLVVARSNLAAALSYPPVNTTPPCTPYCLGPAVQSFVEVFDLNWTALATSVPRVLLQVSQQAIGGATFNPNGKSILVLEQQYEDPRGEFGPTMVGSNQALLIDATSGAIQQTMPGTPAFGSYGFSDDGQRMFMSGALDASFVGARVWDTATGAVVASFSGSWHAAIAPNHDFIALTPPPAGSSQPSSPSGSTVVLQSVP